MRNLYLIAKEDVINLVKNPIWIFYAALFPILLVLILGFLTKDNYGSSITSYDYYGITLMIYAVLNSGMIAANAFMEERIKKPNMRIIYAPGNVKSIYLSKIVASFIFSFLFHVFDMVVLTLIFKIHLNGILQLILLLSLMELFSVTLGVMFCCVFKTETITNQLLSIIINLFALLGGLLFSLDGYGETIRKISALSPAKWFSDTTFQMIYDNNFTSFVPTILGLVVITTLMILICHITFRKEDCLC